jgi:2-iminobutanoate/2-iminopropanoate deaminase
MNRIRQAALVAAAISLAGLGYGLAADARKPHTRVQAKDLPLRAGAPYSQGVMAGDLLYLSGNIGTDPATGKAPAAFADAARQSLDNIGKVLAAADMTWEDVVKVNVFVKDMARYEEFNGIYTSALPAPFPARTFLGVADLPGGGQIEIEAVAVRRQMLR